MPSATRSSSRKRYYSGLTFATLVVQAAGSRGASIPRSRTLIPRKQGGKPGGNSSDTTDSDDTDTDTDDDDPPPKSQSRSSTSVTKTSSQTPTGIGSSATQTHSAGSSNSSNSSQSPLPSQDAILAADLRKPISAGGVVGAVLGSLIITGLFLMVLARCINRARKARKRPQGFVPSDFFNASPPREQQLLHQTEMSQTQSSPLIIPAVAARATSSGSPYSRYSSSWSSNPANTTSTSPSLSPQILTTSLNHTRSVGGNSEQTGSRNSDTASSIHEPLQSPYESPPYSLAASSSTRLSAMPILAAPPVALASLAHEQPGLHRSMIAHQKSLEAEDKTQEGRMEVLKSTGEPQSNDPPPRYDA